MMLKMVSLTALIVFVGCGSSGSATKKNSLTQNSNFSKVETDLIYDYMSSFPNKVQLSIAKIKEGEVTYYGARKEADSTVDTIDNHTKSFMIGSISKLFTSTLLAQMVIDEKIELDDNIENHLPFKLNDNISISYKQLANHTSGVLDDSTHFFDDNFLDNDRYKNFTYSDMEYYLEHNLSLGVAQNSFKYSNFGVATLGYMLTHIENKSYEELLQERILSRLNMTHTTTIRENVKSLVPALMPNDDPIPFGFKSAGGVISTVEDLYAFLLASLSDLPEVLLAQKETFKIDDTSSIGLGWNIFINLETGTKFYFHLGATEGYRSLLILDRESQNGMIILSNLPIGVEGQPILDLGKQLLRIVYTQG